MAESRNTYALQLPRDFVQSVLKAKPRWQPGLSDEQFLASVVIRGDYTSYFKDLQETEAQMKAASERLGFTPNKNKPPAKTNSQPQ